MSLCSNPIHPSNFILALIMFIFVASPEQIGTSMLRHYIAIFLCACLPLYKMKLSEEDDYAVIHLCIHGVLAVSRTELMLKSLDEYISKI